jgi:TRAP-type C4-dicarboxylate transport system permease small subunit
MLNRVDAGVQRIEKALTDVSWIVCVLITFMIVADIFLRFFFNQPLPASWEISEISMPYIVFFPFAYTTTINAHVRVSLLRDLMSPKIQLRFDMVSNLICFFICALLTYWSALRFWESFITNEEILAAIKLPWWVGKMAMPIGMGMFTIRYLMQFFLDLAHHQPAGRG